MEHGIDDAFAERDGGGGALVDRPDELVAVHLGVREELQDEELGHSIHEGWIGVSWGHAGRLYLVGLGMQGQRRITEDTEGKGENTERAVVGRAFWVELG